MTKFFWIDTRGDDYPKGFDVADLIESREVSNEAEFMRWMKKRCKDGPPVIADLKPAPAAPKPTNSPAPPVTVSRDRGAAVTAIRPDIEPDADGDWMAVAPEYSENNLIKDFVPFVRPHYRYATDEQMSYVLRNGLWERDPKDVRSKHLGAKYTDRRSHEIAGRTDLGSKATRLAEKVATLGMWGKMVDGSKTYPELQVEKADFDANLQLLNCPSGVVDLRTGEMSPPNPEQLHSRRTKVDPGGNCPRWEQFLQECTLGDPDLIEYLQIIAGYSLTGETREQKFFFAHGAGGNGKGTFINALLHCMGSYAHAAEAKSFMASGAGGGSSHSDDIASMAGSRLVSIPELESGQRWAEALVKSLTGGDTVSARKVYSATIVYKPTFKLFFSGNHKPHLRDVDPAIRRRLFLIPFEVDIPLERQDAKLADHLANIEAGGILKWAIEGAILWNQRGLHAPERVMQATNEYLNAEDLINSFIRDRLAVGNAADREPSSKVYAAYKEWCSDNGETFTKTNKVFSQDMQAKGYPVKRFNDGKYMIGVRILPAGLV